MNFFPDAPVLWAGLGDNPPESSSYWREVWAMDLALASGRRQKTWKQYCRAFAGTFDYFFGR